MDEYLKGLNPKLEELCLTNRKLESIPDLSYFKNLKKLNISHNKITDLSNLPLTLIELDVSNNKINNIDKLHLIKTLQILNITGNYIENIESFIENLNNNKNLS